MKAKQICMILTVGALSFSAVACGNTTAATTEIEESAEQEAVAEEATKEEATEAVVEAEVKTTTPDEIVSEYVKSTIENHPEFDLIEGETSYEAVELVNTVTIKNWNNNEAVKLENAYVVKSNDEGFKGVVIQGITNGEEVLVYFYTDDSGKLVSTDGIKITSFLPAAKLKEIQ